MKGVASTGDRSSVPVAWSVLGPVLLYVCVVLPQAWLKLLWGDELITFCVARQGSLTRIWQALVAGADPNPPLIHMAVLLSMRCFGVHAWTMRLPSILFGILTLPAMAAILRRWVRPLWVPVGLLAWMATRGFDFSYDARSYGPMMALSMVSLACWLYAGEARGWRRFILLAGLGVGLAAGLCDNYYCVLAWLPVGAGELLRNLQERRFRPGVWIALAVAGLPVIAYLPLIRHSVAEFAPYAWNRPRLSMVGLSYIELVEGIFWPVAGMACYWLLKRRGHPLGIPMADAAALGTLLLYPILGFSLALAGSAMISPRCVAPVCCGFALALAVLGDRQFGRLRGAGQLAVLLLALWVMVRQGVCAHVLWIQRDSFVGLRARVAAINAPEILISDSSLVLPLLFYSDPAVQARMSFPIDFSAIHRSEADDSGEQNLWAGRNGLFPIRIEEFAAERPVEGALVLARPGGWLSQALIQQGWTLTPLAGSTDWTGMGGVSTPMAHPETRLLTLRRQAAEQL